MVAYWNWYFLRTPIREIRNYLTREIRSGTHGVWAPRWSVWILGIVHLTVRFLIAVVWLLMGIAIIGGSLAFFFRATGIW